MFVVSYVVPLTPCGPINIVLVMKIKFDYTVRFLESNPSRAVKCLSSSELHSKMDSLSNSIGDDGPLYDNKQPDTTKILKTLRLAFLFPLVLRSSF